MSTVFVFAQGGDGGVVFFFRVRLLYRIMAVADDAVCCLCLHAGDFVAPWLCNHASHETCTLRYQGVVKTDGLVLPGDGPNGCCPICASAPKLNLQFQSSSSSSAQPPPPAPPPLVVPLCCSRLAPPPDFTPLGDRRMFWSPSYDHRSQSWLQEYSCLRCGCNVEA